MQFISNKSFRSLLYQLFAIEFDTTTIARKTCAMSGNAEAMSMHTLLRFD